ncbi:hypothetical protein BKA80DRAFT_279949 [Phyllosticta citrichinensis]
MVPVLSCPVLSLALVPRVHPPIAAFFFAFDPSGPLSAVPTRHPCSHLRLGPPPDFCPRPSCKSPLRRLSTRFALYAISALCEISGWQCEAATFLNLAPIEPARQTVRDGRSSRSRPTLR